MELTRKNITSVAIVLILLVGLLVAAYLSRNPQILRGRAFNAGDSVEVTHPKTGMKVLGISKIKGTVKTSVNVGKLKGVLQVDGADAKEYKIKFKRVSDSSVEINGTWNSGKYSEGDHNLEVIIYDENSNPPTRLGTGDISVTVVTP